VGKGKGKVKDGRQRWATKLFIFHNRRGKKRLGGVKTYIHPFASLCLAPTVRITGGEQEGEKGVRSGNPEARSLQEGDPGDRPGRYGGRRKTGLSREYKSVASALVVS